MTSVSAGHIIQTPTQPVGSGRPQRESNPGPPHQESRALPQSYRAPQTIWQTRTKRERERERERERGGRVGENEGIAEDGVMIMIFLIIVVVMMMMTMMMMMRMMMMRQWEEEIIVEMSRALYQLSCRAPHKNQRLSKIIKRLWPLTNRI